MKCLPNLHHGWKRGKVDPSVKSPGSDVHHLGCGEPSKEISEEKKG